MRESRTELRRFMREMKKNNPNLICYLQYDKLFVDNKCYVWNDLQAKVVEHFPVKSRFFCSTLHEIDHEPKKAFDPSLNFQLSS